MNRAGDVPLHLESMKASYLRQITLSKIPPLGTRICRCLCGSLEIMSDISIESSRNTPPKDPFSAFIPAITIDFPISNAATSSLLGKR